MNITRILSHLGLTEAVDYNIVDNAIVMLPKTRMVEQVIEHDAVEEVTEEQEVLDAEGLSFDPPQYETVVIVEAQEAYTETVMVEEEYTPAAPSEDALQRAELELRVADLGDVMELVGKYLEGHVASEDESINPEAFAVAHINDPSSSFWRMSIPKPTLAELEAIRANLDPIKAAAAVRKARMDEGRKAREACQNVLDIVAGFNLESELSPEQISSMVATFAQPLQALQLNRPSTAKALITALEPSELVTQEMLSECLELLADY
jgi:hypothetical protein